MTLRKSCFTAQFRMAFCGYLERYAKFSLSQMELLILETYSASNLDLFPSSKSLPLLNQKPNSNIFLAVLYLRSSKQLKTGFCLFLAQLAPSFPEKLITSLWYFKSSSYSMCHTLHLWCPFIQEMWWILQCPNPHARSCSWFLAPFFHILDSFD